MKTTRILPALLAAALLAGCDTVQSVAVTHRMVHQQDLMRDVPARIAAMPPAASQAFALASPFSDHMVLQRDMPVPVWGTYAPGESVEIKLCTTNAGGSRLVAESTATQFENGRWIAFLPPMPAGGPYEILVGAGRSVPGACAVDGTTLTVEDVLFGDVWICGGQSNMEMNFFWGVKDGEKELADADLPQVRLLNVPNVTDVAPRDSFDAKWTACTPEAAKGFSACGFFFGRKLQRELGVPVGLVESDWSGTIAETWLSLEGAATIPGLERAVGNRRRDIADWKNSGPEKFKARHEAWEKEIDPAGEAVAAPDYAEGAGWADAAAPFSFEESINKGYDGVVWLRRAFDLTAAQAAATNAALALGSLDDQDDAFLNGTKVGHTEKWTDVRRYPIPAGLLREGRNTIALRVLDTGGGGGFHGEDKDVPRLEFGDAAPALSLAGGGWRRLAGPALREKPEPKNPLTSGPNIPAACFNGMIAPLFPMAVRGAIWYQGCSNVGRHEQYKTLLPAVAAEWREGFTTPDGWLPFYIAQLAAFQQTHEEPVDSAWAAMRWAQTQIGERIGGTAVLLDVGDHGDIHPKDKRAAGERLAALALAQTYDRTDQELSPVPRESASFHDGAVEVAFVDQRFARLDSRPVRFSPDKEVRGFELAGADGRFVRVAARTCDARDTIRVSVPQGMEPVRVRYAWDDYPDCDLATEAGLPVGPFELPVSASR